MGEKISEIARIQPQASYVETFARPNIAPPAQGKNGLAQLADALSEAEPKFTRFMVGQQQEYIDSQFKEARNKRLSNQLSYAEATALYEKTGGKEGISGGENPYWVKGYKKTDGELAARNEYMGYINEKYNASGLGAALFNTPMEGAQAYSQFLDKTRSEYLKERSNSNDADWLEGFESGRAPVEDMLSGMDLKQRTANNEGLFKESMGQYVGTILDSNAPIEEKARLIADYKQNVVGMYGVSNTDFHVLTVDAVVDKAGKLTQLGRNDEAQQLMQSLDLIPTGTGTLGGTAYARNKTLETEIRMQNKVRTETEWDRSETRWSWTLADRPAQIAGRDFQTLSQQRTQRDWKEKDLQEEETGKAMADIFANPTADYTDKFSEWSKNPVLAPLIPQMERFQQDRIDSKFRAIEDPTVITQAKMDAMTGRLVPSEVLEMVKNKSAGMATASQLLAEIEQFKVNGDKLESMPKNIREIVDELDKDLETAVRGDSLNAGADARIAGIEARQKGKLLMLEWYASNPKATMMEGFEQAEKVRSLIFNNNKFIQNSMKVDPSQPDSKVYTMQTDPKKPPMAPQSVPQVSAEEVGDVKELMPEEQAAVLLRSNPTQANKNRYETHYGVGSVKRALDGR